MRNKARANYIPALPLTSYMTFGKLFNLSRPEHPLFKMKIKIPPPSGLLGELGETIHVKSCLAQSKCSVNGSCVLEGKSLNTKLRHLSFSVVGNNN